VCVLALRFTTLLCAGEGFTQRLNYTVSVC
jgi:hypothetical protein